MNKSKKLYLLLCAMIVSTLGAYAQQPLEVVYNFTNNNYGFNTVSLATLISTLSGNINGKTATNDGVILSVPSTSEAGAVGVVKNNFLCAKSKGAFVLTAPVYYEITKVTFTYNSSKGSWSVNAGSFDGTTWTGNESAIRFTTSSEARIKTMTITLVEKKLPAPDLKVLNASEFLNMTVGSPIEVVFNPAGLPVSAYGNDVNIARFENGKVVPTGVGETTFTFHSAANADYDEGEVSMSVKVYPITLELLNANEFANMMEEDEIQLSFNYNNREITAEGYDSSVARYENGKIIAVGAGQTVFTLKSSVNGYYDGGVVMLPVNVAPYTQPLNVTFDFVNKKYGLNVTTQKPITLQSHSIHNQTATEKYVNMSFKTGGTVATLYPGAYSDHLRLSNKNTLQLTAPEGYVLTGVVFNYMSKSGAWTVSEGNISNPVWEGRASSITFTCTDEVEIQTVNVTLDKYLPKIFVGDFEYEAEGEYYLTVAPETSISLVTQDIADASVFYNIIDEKQLTMTGSNIPVENQTLTFSQSGRWIYEFTAYDASMQPLATANLHVIVKENESQLVNGNHTLDFEMYHYGMPDGEYASAAHNFTGIDTNGIDFFIPNGEKVKHIRGSHLEMEPDSEFQIGLDHHGRAFTTVTFDGEGIENIVVRVGAVELPLDANGSVSFKVIDSSVKSFSVYHNGGMTPENAPKRLAAASGNAAIKAMTMASDISTGIEGVESQEMDAEIYDMNGRRVNGSELEPGLYIRRQGDKTVKILVK